MQDTSSRHLREESGEDNDWGNWELHGFWFLVSEMWGLERLLKDFWFERTSRVDQNLYDSIETKISQPFEPLFASLVGLSVD